MAHTKAAGSTRLGRDSQPKYLGIKLFAGQFAKPGSILVRQRGTRYIPGRNVRRGSDDTLYSIKQGVVQFVTKKMTKYDGSKKLAKVISVVVEK